MGLDWIHSKRNGGETMNIKLVEQGLQPPLDIELRSWENDLVPKVGVEPT